MGIVSRSEVAEEFTWDLSSLYDNFESWTLEYERLEKRVEELGVYKGRLAESAEIVAQAFGAYLDVMRKLECLYVFAHLRSDEDTANTVNLGYFQRAGNLYARIESSASYLTPELLSLDDKRIEDYLASPELAETKRMLSEIVRFKPHTLSKEEENLLAMGLEVFGASSKIFSQLTNADMKFGSILVDGEEQPLTNSTFVLFLRDTRRDIRKAAFEQYYKGYDEHKNTVSATLTAALKKDVYMAQVRKFPSCLDRALFSDNVTRNVYENLIATVSKHLEPLHRYYKLRAERLGLEESQRIYDTYVPLVSEVSVENTYAEAAELVCEASAPLGADYVETLKRGLSSARWVDVYENEGKRSGAYSSGCYESPPFILMNYKGKELGDVFTLAHEAGHSMHSYYSRKTQAYQDSGYTIFVAEVASTLNEQLLASHLQELYKDDKKLSAYLINQQIDDIKSTLYRQTMFAEFEKVVHEKAEANEALTLDLYTEIYHALLKKYFGESVNIEQIDALECLRIPHFYSAFYVYKYATGLAAAVSLSVRILSGDTEARDRYLRFLSSGCSKHPLDLLEDAGVDMRSSQAIEDTLQRFGQLVDSFFEIEL